MPISVDPRSDPRAASALPGMSARVASQAKALRNIVNSEELNAWLGALAADRLELQEGAVSKRDALCEKWLGSVGRNWMARNGEASAWAPDAQERSNAPEWARAAQEAGAPLDRLSLSSDERERLASVLDWMRSEAGPALDSDWSKVSVEQAARAEREWVEAKAKAALKKDLEAADAAGTERFSEADPSEVDGRAGWRWVEVKTADALDREGALMRHCVGSYAKEVADGKKAVYSLRDPENKPRLTIETVEGDLRQLKAFANKACPNEMLGDAARFAVAFKERCAQRGWRFGLWQDWERVAAADLPGYGFAIGGAPIPEGWEARLRGELDGSKASEARAGELLPHLVALGWTELALKAAEVADATKRDWALVKAGQMGRVEIGRGLLPRANPLAYQSAALSEAAKNDHLEMVELLLPVSNPRGEESEALRNAALNGNVAMAKLLLPVSDPLARESRALSSAVASGSLEMVELLLPVSDPLAQGSLALDAAIAWKRPEMIQLIQGAIDEIKKKSAPPDIARQRLLRESASEALAERAAPPRACG